MFWIVFQLAALVGFIFIGIVSFKLTDEQMRAEAGKFLNNSVSTPVRSISLNILFFSDFSPNIAQPCVSFFFVSRICCPRFVLRCRLAFVTLLLFVHRVVLMMCYALTFGFLALDLGVDLFFWLYQVSRSLDL
jgi:hypothetical protein